MSDSISKVRRELRVRKYNLTGLLDGPLNKSSDSLSSHYLTEILGQAREQFGHIKELQTLVMMEITDMKSVGSEVIDEELKDQSSKNSIFNDKVNADIGHLMSLLTLKSDDTSRSQSASAPPLPAPSLNVKLPELKISFFSDNSKDPFEFFRFIGTFNNALDSVPGVTKAVRLVYLKSYCRGRALALIENLAVNDHSYKVALELLESEFLDKDALINLTISELINCKPCSCLESNMNFLTFLKGKLAELERFDVDVFDDGTGELLIGNIVRGKMYSVFLQELCRKTNSNYPNIENILDHSVSVYKLLKPSESNTSVSNQRTFVSSSNSQQSARNRHSFGSKTENKGQMQAAQSKTGGGCKLCSMLNHSSSHCRKYSNHDVRTKRAVALGLCSRCLSARHAASACPGAKGELPYPCQSCRAPTHVTPMCPSMVLSLSAAKTIDSSRETR